MVTSQPSLDGPEDPAVSSSHETVPSKLVLSSDVSRPTTTNNNTSQEDPNEESPSEQMTVVSDLTTPTYSHFPTTRERKSSIAYDSKVLKRSLGGQHDPLTKLPFDKVGLVGRDLEIETIQHVYEHDIVQGRHTQAITLSGTSGVGKTSVAYHAVQGATAAKETELSSKRCCLMAGGKWSLIMTTTTDTTHNEPLSILRGILHNLGLQIRQQHPELRERILQEFEHSLDAVGVWMPDLLKGDDDNNDNDDKTIKTRDVSEYTTCSMAQLRFATTSLLAIVDCPLILVLDDAQWADSTSLDLLKCWATDESLSQVLILVCYRSEDVDEAHGLTRHFLKPLQEEAAVPVQEIKIDPLTAEQTTYFVTNLLSLSSDKKTTNFAQLLHKYTLGNPFYLVSLIQSLVDEALLSYNLGTLTWVWDLDGIKTTTSATDNVVDIVRKKLMHSEQARSLLPVAATLGADFAEATLMTVCAALAEGETSLPLEGMGLSSIPKPSELQSWLDICELDGFLDHFRTPDGDGMSYKFVHDRIQEAALALLAPVELGNLQYEIGRILSTTVFDDEHTVSSSSASNCNIFTAVNLLNAARKTKMTVEMEDSPNLKLLLLNHAAGERAMSKASFHLALDYFEIAIDLLREKNWMEAPQLCAHSFAGAALAAFNAGDTGG